MPRKSRLKLPPLDLGRETIGQRIARLRKAQGLTQTELAQRIGIVQGLVSDYELGNLRLSAEMAVRFAQALKVSTDELLGVKSSRRTNGVLSLKLTRRLQRIEALSPTRQKLLLQTIDTFLRDAERQQAGPRR
jgi:transcriptional regulator with XRE-family HTH domain